MELQAAADAEDEERRLDEERARGGRKRRVRRWVSADSLLDSRKGPHWLDPQGRAERMGVPKS